MQSSIHIIFSGVYSNLQNGYDVSYSDVDKAINLVCEETSPVELDVTSFLQSMCGHLRLKINQVTHEILQEQLAVEPLENQSAGKKTY